MMGKKHYVNFAFIIAGLVAYSSPGTLGSVADTGLNCPETDAGRNIDELLQQDKFKPEIRDSAAVNWWTESGYDFLNYRCIYIKKRLIRIMRSVISIRSYYDPKKEEWIFAKEFSGQDNVKAKHAMHYLLRFFQGCG